MSDKKPTVKEILNSYTATRGELNLRWHNESMNGIEYVGKVSANFLETCEKLVTKEQYNKVVEQADQMAKHMGTLLHLLEGKEAAIAYHEQWLYLEQYRAKSLPINELGGDK